MNNCEHMRSASEDKDRKKEKRVDGKAEDKEN
jgi:hypothetical protein